MAKQQPQADEEFSKAFDDAPDGDTTPSADDEFGPADSPESSGEGGPAVTIALEAEPKTNGDDKPAPAGPDAPAEPDQAESPEDEQRRKSWEGRLKKMEEELKAREAAIAAREKGAAPADEGSADEEASETPAQEAAETSPDGDEDLQKSHAALMEDFGPDFAGHIQRLARAEAMKVAAEHAGKAAEPVAQRIDSLIGEIQNAFAAHHFSAIKDAHDDFEAVVASPEFKTFLDGMPDEKKQKAMEVIDHGRASQIVSLLNDFKAASKQSEPDKSPADAWDEEKLSAAEAVPNTSPVRIPDRPKPASNGDFDQAWDEAPE